ncbi:FkbM family methyltransferase [Desulfovibrio sp. OttesenSCG-928-F07]|nr:FkbM family methyltransferase [Desulfovibrio sp. OttesenSCG-928-F07]
MNLFTHLNKVIKWRKLTLPETVKSFVFIIRASQLPHIAEVIQSYPHATISHIVITDNNDHLPDHMVINIKGKTQNIPVTDVVLLIEQPELTRLFLLEPTDTFALVFIQLYRVLGQYNLKEFYLHRSKPFKYFSAVHDPDFYNNNSEILEQIYAALATDEDRAIYAGRIKAMLTGDPGYIPLSTFSEYMHPLVQPEEDDIMLDGGVSDMVEVQKSFSNFIGPRGRIFGFEPIPYMFEIAKNKLSEHKNYTLFCKGPGAHEEKVHFADLRDSSRMATPGSNTIECEITSIDAFMQQNKIRRLNCIKLDIEGSELDAINGAEETIKKFKPKLIICLYHKPEDIYTIPARIKELVPEYELHIAHSSFHFIDTILYAKVPE